MQGCNLGYANLAKSDLSNAQAQFAQLESAIMVGTTLKSTNLAGALIYGISTWDLILDDAIQTDLRITKQGQPVVTVDNIEVAQFVYLLLKSPKIREVIETVGRKLVLILGRFTPVRKAVLEAVRDGLRMKNYIPMVVDFDVPSNRDVTETVAVLAHMARFIVADITEPRSIPQELMAIVPFLPSVPVQPLLLGTEAPYGMFEHFSRYPWVLETCIYPDRDFLIRNLATHVISPAERYLTANRKPT
jgi:hypothetical protein